MADIELTTAPAETSVDAADEFYFNDVSETPDAINRATLANVLGADLSAIKGLSPSNDDILQRKAGGWTNRTVAQVKTDLGLTGTNSGDETAASVGVLINGAGAATPNDTDLVATAESSVLKKITWTNVKAFLKTYFDTVYQALLVSGTNIKTINGSSVLGSGDLTVSGGVGGTVGTTDNAVPRADGTGGSTLQGSSVLINDDGDLTARRNYFTSGGTTYLAGINDHSVSVAIQGVEAFRFDNSYFMKMRGDTSQLGWVSGNNMALNPVVGLRRYEDGVLGVTAGWNGSAYENSDGAVVMRQRVIVKTSAYTLTNAETNTLYTNEGATALVVLTLPTAVAGLQYEFYVADADGIQIVAASGDTIRFEGTVSAAAGNAQSTTVGSSVILKAINATEWVAIGKPGGSWTLT